MEIHCDKCGSASVIQRCVDPMPPQPVYSMSDVVKGKVKQPGIIHAVMVYHTYVLECQNCHYVTKEFIEGSGGVRPSVYKGDLSKLTSVNGMVTGGLDGSLSNIKSATIAPVSPTEEQDK